MVGLTVSGTLASTSFIFYAWYMRAVSDKAISENVREMIAAAEIDIALQRQKGLVSFYLLDNENSKWLEELGKLETAFRSDIKRLLGEFRADTERATVTQVQRAYELYDGVRDHIVALHSRGNRSEARDLYLTELYTLYSEVAKLSDQILANNKADLQNAWRQSQSKVWRLTYLVIASAVLTVSLGLTLAWILSVRLYRPLGELTKRAEIRLGKNHSLPSFIDNDLEALGRHMEVLVTELEDAQSQVAASQQELNHSERLAAIGNAVAHVFHDIKNRIFVAGLYATRIQKLSKTEQETQDYVSILCDELKKLEGMLHALRDYSKPVPCQLETSCLNTLVRETVGRMAEEISDTVLFNLDLDMDIPSVKIDRERIEQVILNLIRNSIEAMDLKGTITITTKAQDGKNVILTVEDDGPGVPEDIRDKVFEPFFTTKKTGNGLGLAICSQIMREHGALIKFDHGNTKGTKFRLEFPGS